MRRWFLAIVSFMLVVGMLSAVVSPVPPSAAAAALANPIRISQVYGGGGGSTGYYKYDYVELFNAGTVTADLTGWSLQYGSATGNFASSTGNLYAFPAGTSLAAGKYMLIQLGAAGSGGIDLPVTPDLVTGNLAMGASNGKIALANIATALGCGADATPCTLPHANIVDMGGWGVVNLAEGGVSINNGVALTNQQGGARKNNGCQDTDHNGNDFDVLSGAALLPRNGSTPAYMCGAPTLQFVISKSAPVAVNLEEAFTYTLTAVNQTGDIRSGVVITDSLPADVTVGTISDGGIATGNVVSWTIATLADGASVTRTVQVTAPNTVTALINSDYGMWASDWLTRATGSAVQTQVTLPPGTPVAIGTARGMLNQTVTIAGRATMYTGGFFAGTGNVKFYIQDATGGIAVQCFGSNGAVPVVTLGDLVTVTGKIGAYNAETQIVPVNNVSDVTVVDGDPADAPAPLPKAISEVDNDPDALGWLVRVHGTLNAIRSYSFSYELDLIDGSGHTALVYIDKNTGMNVDGLTVGQEYEITGLSEIYTTKYQLKPRQQSDIVPYVDDTPPTVITTAPAADATDANRYDTVRATFSEALDSSTVNAATFALQGPGGAVAGTVSYDVDAYRAIFAPATALDMATRYTATLTTGITDLAGNPLAAPYTWGFTTNAVTDTTAPLVVAVTPTADATGVPVNVVLTATFNEAIKPGVGTFVLVGPNGAHPGSMFYDPDTHQLSFAPLGNLQEQTTYTATLTTNITDLAGNPLAAPYTWSFTTAALTIIPIYDLQYSTAGGTYPSPYANQTVNTTGTVCALLPKGYVVTQAPGVWRSMYVYFGNGNKPPVGMQVQITGLLEEYSGMTEFSYPPIVAGQGYNPDPTVCTPTVVTTLDVPYNDTAKTEPYESVLVEYRNITITNLTTSRALFVDGTGGTGAISLAGYVPPDMAVGMVYKFARGMLLYTSSQYRLVIPSAADIQDAIPPQVTATTPTADASNVNRYRPVAATFNEPLLAASVNAANFTLTGPGGALAGMVTYDVAARRAIFTPDAPLAASATYTAHLTAGIKDIADNALVPVSWSFTTGGDDTTAPSILSRKPAAGATNVPVGASVTITFSESLKDSTLSMDNFTLSGPFGALVWDTLTYDDAAHRLVLKPRGFLLPTTRYTVTVSAAVSDWAGNALVPADRVWTFTTEAEQMMHAYHGDIHNHTSYSDGSGTSQMAFSQARTAGLDFLAVTDHSYAISDSNWETTMNDAAAHTQDGVFIGIAGFEYTQGAEGHINVYNTVRRAVRSNVGCTYCDYTPNLEAGQTVQGFYNWLAITGTVAVDDAGTLMMFNHPGWMNFNDWAYHPEVEHIAQLEEVGNGTGTSYFFSFDEWIRSLDYGWKVGATNNSDTHRPNWGEATPHRTGIVAPELTKRALFDAMRARRTFATEDSNYEIFFKANGYWMGAELPNTGEILFEISFNDPDVADTGDRTTVLELYTNHGEVITATQPGMAAGTWNFTLTDLAPGVHYFFVKATQADGDRIVSSPVWTMGVENVSITDLTVQPSVPTTYNPSLYSARVTNRGASSQTLMVEFRANGDVICTEEVTIDTCDRGPCPDAFAVCSWTPAAVGPLTITAELVQGVPVSDNPGDNQRALHLTATDQEIPLIVIDAAHNNIAIDARSIRLFVDDLNKHGYNVLLNLDAFTTELLNPDTVKLVIINGYGPDPLTETETQALADFVAGGGSLWLNAHADFNRKIEWVGDIAWRMNSLIEAIQSRVSERIPVRFNDDEVLDGNNNNGYPFGIEWHTFPAATETGVGVNVEHLQAWSVCSLINDNYQALRQSDLGEHGHIFVLGDLDSGYTDDSYQTPFRTHNEDSEEYPYVGGDAYIYPETIPLVAGAGYAIPNAGRIFFYGDSNDSFNTFAYTAGDGKQNELFNLQTVMWLLGNPLQKQDIAEVRPVENLHTLVWVEGIVTAAYGEFFNVLYVQDETGGITVHAPAGDIYAADYLRGKRVRVIGTIGAYQGDMEIEFFEAEMVQVIGEGIVPDPLPFSTYDVGLFENQGWLVQITGTVLAKSPELDTLVVDDGSGPIRAFLDGYNGTWSDINIMDRVTVIGLASSDGEGARIRVRHYQNDTRPDDAWVLPTSKIYLPLILRNLTP